MSRGTVGESVQRFKDSCRRFHVPVAMGAGAVMTLGHAPADFPWGFFIAVPVALWLTARATPRQAAWIGWGLGFGYFVTGLHWMGHAFLVDPERHAWMIPFALTLLPGLLALFWAGAFWLARRVWPKGLAAQAFTLAAAWTLAEILRSHALTGFPWALPAYAWAKTPLLQSASWAGPFGLSLVVLFLCSALIPALIQRRIATAAAAAIGFAGLWFWGDSRVPEDIAYASDATLVRLVQPNAPQHLKWDPDYMPVFYQRQLEATSAPVSKNVDGDGEEGGNRAPDLILWPETAVPFSPENWPEGRRQIAEAAGGATVVSGAVTPPTDGGQTIHFNSLISVLSDGSSGPRYDKQHLVPFGEYLPFAWLLEPLGVEKLVAGQFGRGEGPRTVALPGQPVFAAAICYEMIFPHEVIGSGPRPEWIATITNDAWFGGFAGPQQHLDQALYRAVEQGLPVARAANTGISAMIDPYGRVTASLPLHTHGGIDARLPARLDPTIFARMGVFSTGLLTAALIGWLIAMSLNGARVSGVAPPRE